LFIETGLAPRFQKDRGWLHSHPRSFEEIQVIGGGRLIEPATQLTPHHTSFFTAAITAW
jgi:hypothetical protein